MRKKELEAKTEAAVTSTKAALQLVYDSLNKGQRQKLIRLQKVKKLFDQYEVKYQ